ncbi:MAG: aldo/keto reductase [Ilumatobacter sp.]|uniref:aldo/keto reductase n=1 Tax=Ilumatobacter sp. TaxID=1967498 RepID=UPI003C738CD2
MTTIDDQPTVRLPSGATIPAFGLGTWELEADEVSEIVGAALDLGVRHVDTAQMYGNEADVGRAIAASDVERSEVFLTTKVANDRHGPDELRASVEESLEKLRTDHVDLLLIHWPVDFDRMDETLAALASVHEDGLASHLGVSNFTREQLDRSVDLAPLEVLQCECHPFLQQVDLRAWCADHGWGFTAYSPLARGEVFHSDVLDDIAAEKDVSSGAVALAWLLAQPQVVTIPKTTDAEHLEENCSALTIELDQLELDRISGLEEGRRLVDPDFAPW